MYMLTATGGTFDLWLANPTHSIDVLDIAAALAKINRWGGHTTRLYSVAEHSLHVSTLMEREHGISNPEALLCGLMHDAHEAYTADLIRPAKEVLDALGRGCWQRWEAQVQRQVLERYGLAKPMRKWHDEVKRADNTMLLTEARDVMPPRGSDSQFMLPLGAEASVQLRLREYAGTDWQGWRDLFIERFAELREGVRLSGSACHA